MNKYVDKFSARVSQLQLSRPASIYLFLLLSIHHKNFCHHYLLQ
jgi:hypothetical protein